MRIPPPETGGLCLTFVPSYYLTFIKWFRIRYLARVIRIVKNVGINIGVNLTILALIMRNICLELFSNPNVRVNGDAFTLMRLSDSFQEQPCGKEPFMVLIECQAVQKREPCFGA